MYISKRLSLVLAAPLLILGCNAKVDLPLEQFDDIKLAVTQVKKFGSLSGIKAVYCFYGKMPTIKVGEAAGITHKFRYRIKDLLDKYPELKSDKALVAQEEQEKVINQCIQGKG